MLLTSFPQAHNDELFQLYLVWTSSQWRQSRSQIFTCHFTSSHPMATGWLPVIFFTVWVPILKLNSCLLPISLPLSINSTSERFSPIQYKIYTILSYSSLYSVFKTIINVERFLQCALFLAKTVIRIFLSYSSHAHTETRKHSEICILMTPSAQLINYLKRIFFNCEILLELLV